MSVNAAFRPRLHRDWVRELNILLYLNEGHEEHWGGHLEMQHAVSGRTGRVAPKGNRLVIMLTKEHTLHGYKPISFPEGRMRTSIASYAYTRNSDFGAVPDRSTLWKPTDAGTLKRWLAEAMPSLVAVKRRLMGRSTARRAQREKT